MPSPTCPKCRTEMQAGFIPHLTRGEYFVTSWLAGTPKPSFWTGIRVRRKDLLPIVTYRCPACGYLESYAR